MTARTRQLALRLALPAAGLAAAFLLAELALRLFVLPRYWQIVDAAADWAPHRRLGWVQKADYSTCSRRKNGDLVRFATNIDGLQPETARRERSPGTTRVMIFGDSAVVGRSVPGEQRIHAWLADRLQASGQAVEVFNAGVEGYSTDQSLIRMEMLLPLYRPDVVIHCVCGNDFSANSVGVNSGLNKPRFVLESDGRLNEIPPAKNEKLVSPVPWPRSWIRRSAVYGLVWPALVVWRAQHGTFRNQNLLGLNDPIYYDPGACDRIDWKLFEALLARMQAVSDRYGAKFLFYAIPDALEVWDPWIEQRKRALKLSDDQFDRFALERRLEAAAARNKLEFVPVIRHLMERQIQGPFHLLPIDRHCNGAGYRLTAEALAPAIARERPAQP